MLLLAVGLAFAVPGLSMSLLDPDEGLYADVAREMVAAGDWVVPRFNGLPYLEKPPLYFWLTALAFLVTGFSEWVLRGWSVLAALGTSAVAWRLGRRLYGPRGGVVAGVMLLTSAGYALYLRKASTDFVFAFSLALAVYGFIVDAERPDRGRRRFFLLYAGSALALLSKGLIGALFPALIVGVSLRWYPGLRWRDLNLTRGLTLVAALTVPWHALVAWRDPSLFRFYLVDNQILRFLNLREFLEDDVAISTPGYLVATFLWFFPWSVFLLARPAPTALVPAWRVTAVWAAVVVGFFALSGSKLEYYALPALPAFAVLVAGGWTAGRDVGRWLGVGLAGCATVGTAAIWLGPRMTPEQILGGLAHLNVYYRILREQGAVLPFESVRPFGLLLQGLGVTLLAGWVIAGVCWMRGWRRGALLALVGVGAGIAALIVELLILIEPHHSTRAVAEVISGMAAPRDLVVHEGSLEYSAALPFYTGRRIRVVNGARGDLEFASRRPEAREYFLDAAALAALWRGPDRVFLVTQQGRGRGVAATLPRESVRVVGRFGSRWLYASTPAHTWAGECGPTGGACRAVLRGRTSPGG
ncbi:MAG: glycosyltransferase family 39 protein [Candidatus Rokubacteria bacterium]|nr:glycosyltransferase family 39 protein [Candidatus Rokubacteria bacterium]